MRIGILGGTFDPIHKGHLALAKAALDKLKLDTVYFVPAKIHPFESKRQPGASPEERIRMVQLAIDDEARFAVSDIELKREGISYTVDTLREFRAQHPKDDLFFITGGDWGKDLSKWKEIETVFALAQFVVARRPGFDTSRLPKEVKLLDFVPLDISSRNIREKIRRKNDISTLIPSSVTGYIHQHHLYQAQA